MKPFRYRLKKEIHENPDDLMKLAESVGSLIDQTAVDIFQTHVIELLNKPITYIIPAVWGAHENGALSSAQEQMNRSISPVVEDIIQTLQVDSLSESQIFALGYLIRGLLVSKITYMIEKLKNQLIEKIIADCRRNESLSDVETLGNA